MALKKTNTTDLNSDIAKGFYNMNAIDLLNKKAIGAWALARLNQWLGWVDREDPEFFEITYKDIEVTTNAVIVAWTLNTATGWAVSITWNGNLLDIYDLVSYNSRIYTVRAKADTSITLELTQGTDIEIPSWAVIKLVTSATVEWDNGDKQDKTIQVASKNYNYTQIVKGHGAVTGSVWIQMLKSWRSVVAEMDTQAQVQFMQKLKSMVMSSNRINRSVNINWVIKKQRIAGWIPFFTKNIFDESGEVTGARTDNLIAVNGVPAKTHLNQAFTKAIKLGWKINTIAWTVDLIATFANIDESKVQILNADGSNARVVGGWIQRFKSPIDVDWNMIEFFEITDELPTWEILVYNSSAVTFEAMDGRFARTYSEAVAGWDDNYRVTYADELTVCVKEAWQSFIYLTWCTAV